MSIAGGQRGAGLASGRGELDQGTTQPSLAVLFPAVGAVGAVVVDLPGPADAVGSAGSTSSGL